MAETVSYKKTLSGSVGAGMGSLFSPGGKTYYILEHKISSRYHKAGEYQEIIVDEIEIGRDPGCQVRFDEHFETVSRRHAAIVRDGDNWKLVQLSKTNTTFLNGHPVKDQWYLQNGDEIQLSVNGPKLGFVIPQGNNRTVGSIGLSRRLSLFRQQALRPYRTALITVASLLLIALGAGGFFLWKGNNVNKDLQARLEQTQQELNQTKEQIVGMEGQHRQELDSLNNRYEALETSLRSGHRRSPASPVRNTKVDNRVQTTGESEIDEEQREMIVNIVSNTYYLTVTGYRVTFADGTEVELKAGEKLDYDSITLTVPTIHGAGFLLKGGIFVTTRDNVEPWLFKDDAMLAMLNVVSTEGAKITAHIVCTSPSGDEQKVESTQFILDRSGDKRKNSDGLNYTKVTINDRVYAYMRLEFPGGLDYEKNHHLKKDENLLLLGYPDGNSETISPDAGTAISAVRELDDGFIMMSNITATGLVSGSAVIAEDNGSLVVVGVLLGIVPENKMGLAIPLSAMKL